MRHSETRLARNSSRGPVNEVRSPAASDVRSLMTQKSVPASRKTKPKPGQPPVKNKPGVGHVIGVVRYAQGDTEGGQRCMVKPTRSTVIIGATIATGGGTLVAGSVAVAAAASYDAVYAQVYKAQLQGSSNQLAISMGVLHAVETRDARDIHTSVTSPVVDFGAGGTGLPSESQRHARCIWRNNISRCTSPAPSTNCYGT